LTCIVDPYHKDSAKFYVSSWLPNTTHSVYLGLRPTMYNFATKHNIGNIRKNLEDDGLAAAITAWSRVRPRKSLGETINKDREVNGLAI
jgi:hypothetical protein